MVASTEELTADLLSIHHETNLSWDQYVYEEKDGRLFDPIRKRKIAGTANGDEVEEGVNKQLEEWFLTHDSGIAVWISPRSSAKSYPEEKIIVHRIAYELIDGKLNEKPKKILFCASHQFKTNFKNPEELRGFIFPEEDKEESIFEIINWLVKVSQKKIETNVQNSEKRRLQAENYARQFQSGTSIEWIIYDMTQTKFLGENPISCSRGDNVSIAGGFGFEDRYGPLKFICPKCGRTNERPPGQLLSNCQHCGGDVRC